ncbi:ZINC FINGER PROTEIN ZAT5 [Salix purpurea]|uniref:ZINC FINGER PROTEIN ZAT5 n=1 Tax=Salix purpurea TaxID=77065 RepID=A0A9Q0UBX9_SALPP|nr:ZINC FINGER PROTEIN ZAT5 [Salix purpurea]
MKRSLYAREIDSIAMANCLVFLSKGGESFSFPSLDHATNDNSPTRVFECKTCSRQFPSFQALGGHRASHKKPRLTGGDGRLESQSPAKPKAHECSICGLEFAIGQALGGHMRRHRAAVNDQNQPAGPLVPPGSDHRQAVPVVKKSNSRRVLCLDLNLTPNENDMELFKLEKAATIVDCFF